MGNGNPAGERRLSKFSNIDRGTARDPRGASAAKAGPDVEPPLADILERIIRDGVANNTGPQPADSMRPERLPAEQALPGKLIEELRVAQEQVWFPPEEEDNKPRERSPLQALAASEAEPRSVPKIREARAAKLLPAIVQFCARLFRFMRPRNWHRRYFNVIERVHRYIFDRRIESLLFIKTLPPASPEASAANEPARYVYRGPFPSRVLNWALSAMPSDVKRYAFVDFRAANGRTLLLAARRPFEYAVGYAFDASECEELEMNLSQYPRSYMSCRDVRAVRADRHGVVIPPQPSVLFFPDTIREGHLDIVMSHVSASFRLNPRPLYLIFENAGHAGSFEHQDSFQRQHLPLLNRIKAALFSPANVVVYRSIESEAFAGD